MTDDLRLIYPVKEYEKKAFEYIREFLDFSSEINGTGGLDRYDNYDEWLLKVEKDLDLPNIPEGRVPANTYFFVRMSVENKSRDDLFSAPFLYGHSLYYIPDCKTIKESPCPKGFTCFIKEGKEIHMLYELPGFYNALQYDKEHARPDILAVYAMKGDEIAGVAGASIDSGTMWQIGIDVLPPFRNAGLATYLVSNLAIMIMERGIVPYYGTASSNVASQAVAYRSGFIPAWMCTYRNVLDGKSPYSIEIENI